MLTWQNSTVQNTAEHSRTEMHTYALLGVCPGGHCQVAVPVEVGREGNGVPMRGRPTILISVNRQFGTIFTKSFEKKLTRWPESMMTHKV